MKRSNDKALVQTNPKKTRIEEEPTSETLRKNEDNVNMCLQLHLENKITKHNAWTLTIIDSFLYLIQNHHQINFSSVGSFLEASSKVFGLRVNSVYTDTLQMNVELSRQAAKSLNKRLNGNQDEDHAENLTDERDDKSVIKKKKQRKNRNVSTVAKNKETLNSKLDTVPLSDPFFARMNLVVGDINSSKRVMLNILPTQSSVLKLRQNNKFWDAAPANLVDIESGFDVAEIAEEFVSSLKSISGPLSDTLRLRGNLSGYVISESPMEDEDDDEDSVSEMSFDNELSNTQQTDNSHMDLQFDINAEVEPINETPNFVIDCGDMNNQLNEMNEEELNAIIRCRGLRRQQDRIEDMQPVENSSGLEYSYRSLANIKQYWAGPSHWKFLQTIKSSNQRIIREINTKRKKTRKSIKELTYENFLSFEPSYVKKTYKLKKLTLSRNTICHKWDANKLKLPIDYRIDQEIFEKFKYAPNCRPVDAESIVIDTERDLYSQIEDHDTDTEPEFLTGNRSCKATSSRHSSGFYEYETISEDAGATERAFETDIEMEFNTTIARTNTTAYSEVSSGFFNETRENDFEISSIYPGAPEKVEKIRIPYAKRAKVVDMKSLKHSCWDIIGKKTAQISQDFDVSSFNESSFNLSSSSLDHYKTVTFKTVTDELPRILPKKVSKNVTIPIAFYAVLNLANQNSLILNQHADLDNFDIITEN